MNRFHFILLIVAGVDFLLILYIWKNFSSRVKWVFLGWVFLLSFFLIYFAFRIYRLTTG